MKQPIGYILKQMTDKIKIKADASLKTRNLTFSQVRVLEYISTKGGTVTQKSIEEYLNVSHPTVVGIVSRMEQKGYLVCFPDKEDKRNKIVELTEQAKRLSSELQEEMVSMERKLLQGLTEEQIESLYQMLAILSENIDE